VVSRVLHEHGLERQTLTLRLPSSLVEALDRHAERMSEALPPGARSLSRSDAIRALLLAALADAGEQTQKRRK
jgi:hypothetical protein